MLAVVIRHVNSQKVKLVVRYRALVLCRKQAKLFMPNKILLNIEQKLIVTFNA
jgi:hypothetical protein